MKAPRARTEGNTGSHECNCPACGHNLRYTDYPTDLKCDGCGKSWVLIMYEHTANDYTLKMPDGHNITIPIVK